jgi:hypothetical protein
MMPRTIEGELRRWGLGRFGAPDELRDAASFIKNWLLFHPRDGAQIIYPTLRGATPKLHFRHESIALAGAADTDGVDLRSFTNGAVDACSIRDGARQLARILERQICKAGSRSEQT